jgi:Phosphatidylinositol-specific phospholipase C, Y domain/C2 domain
VESDDDSDDGPKDAPKKPKVKVLRALSNLGIYATTTHFHSFSHPLSKLFNHVHSFSERVFKKLADEDPKALQEHNSKYLTRVYPFGLRFTSTNEEPAVFWRHGAQMVALNWQKFDLGMMENEALFRGTKGMILKPAVMEATVKPVVDITIEVIAAAGLPCPQHLKDIDKVQPFVKVEIRNGDKLKKETRVVKHSGACVVWEEVLNFGKIVDNLAFVRYAPVISLYLTGQVFALSS